MTQATLENDLRAFAVGDGIHIIERSKFREGTFEGTDGIVSAVSDETISVQFGGFYEMRQYARHSSGDKFVRLGHPSFDKNPVWLRLLWKKPVPKPEAETMPRRGFVQKALALFK